MRKLASFALGAGLILAVAGCSGVQYRGPEITYAPFIKDISEGAANLARSDSLSGMVGAVELYASVNNIEDARPVAKRILARSAPEGLRAYGLLQKCINKDPKLARAE